MVLSWLDCGRSCEGSILGVGSGIAYYPVFSISTKSAYCLLLSELSDCPHCVEKFRPGFGCLYWPSTWHQLFLFSPDCPVIVFHRKEPHCDLYTADYLASFGYPVPLACFCSALIVFFLTLVPSLLSSRLAPSITLHHVLFGF